MQPIIHNLFPTPIYTTKINRGFTKQELNFVKEQEKHSSKNQGNINTKDNYILNKKEFKNIKKFLNDCCKDYIKTIICPKNNVELYITQSWLNYTKENEYHHKHNHGNSIVSGVLYFNANKDNDNITFFNKENYEQISPEINNNKFNVWNSQSWWLPVETGKLMMFPSSTKHQVDNKKGYNIRVSHRTARFFSAHFFST